MAGNIVITRAGIKDLAILVELSITTFRDTFGPDNGKEDMDKYVAEEMNAGKLSEELREGNNYIFLAWYNGTLAGYAKVRPNKEPGIESNSPLELERIYVRQQYTRKKIGVALMLHCLEFAQSYGHDVLWLGVWEHNRRAVKFYKQWGFELCGSHPFLLGNDMQTDVLMKRKV